MPMSVMTPNVRQSDHRGLVGAVMSQSAVIIANETEISCHLEELENLARFLISELSLHPEVELGIRLVGVEEMTELHLTWMHEPGPTDVLSFPMDEIRSAPPGVEPERGILGDIVLCPQVAHLQAGEAGRSLDQELQYLMTHGMLHLIGYDHMTDLEHEQMFTLTDQLLERWHESGQVTR